MAAVTDLLGERNLAAVGDPERGLRAASRVGQASLRRAGPGVTALALEVNRQEDDELGATHSMALIDPVREAIARAVRSGKGTGLFRAGVDFRRAPRDSREGVVPSAWDMLSTCAPQVPQVLIATAIGCGVAGGTYVRRGDASLPASLRPSSQDRGELLAAGELVGQFVHPADLLSERTLNVLDPVAADDAGDAGCVRVHGQRLVEKGLEVDAGGETWDEPRGAGRRSQTARGNARPRCHAGCPCHRRPPS